MTLCSSELLKGVNCVSSGQLCSGNEGKNLVEVRVLGCCDM